MKKKPKKRTERLRGEYDFAEGTRGKYAGRIAPGSGVVVLDPDLAKTFRDSAAVNEALRAFLKLPAKKKRAE